MYYVPMTMMLNDDGESKIVCDDGNDTPRAYDPDSYASLLVVGCNGLPPIMIHNAEDLEAAGNIATKEPRMLLFEHKLFEETFDAQTTIL